MEIASPFPGMDPWMETFWEDVHQRALTYAADALQEQLPPGLRARLQERVYVETPVERLREIAPDVRVVEHPRLPNVRHVAKPPAGDESDGGVAVAEPIFVKVAPDDEVVESAIDIVDTRAGSRLVTAIELLSRSNKRPGAGMVKYRQKQAEVVAARANLVEIDLLRGGQRVLLCPPENIPPDYRTPYQVCVYRAANPTGCEVYDVPLRQRLPIIRVPLRDGDDDATLDLQALIRRTYHNAAYDFLDYAAEPVPPLPPEDAAWADDLLKRAGKR
jgi:hypothetical protein